jgi:hypothetical protein
LPSLTTDERLEAAQALRAWLVAHPSDLPALLGRTTDVCLAAIARVSDDGLPDALAGSLRTHARAARRPLGSLDAAGSLLGSHALSTPNGYELPRAELLALARSVPPTALLAFVLPDPDTAPISVPAQKVVKALLNPRVASAMVLVAPDPRTREWYLVILWRSGYLRFRNTEALTAHTARFDHEQDKPRISAGSDAARRRVNAIAAKYASRLHVIVPLPALPTISS